jgi:hypothetical protein
LAEVDTYPLCETSCLCDFVARREPYLPQRRYDAKVHKGDNG